MHLLVVVLQLILHFAEFTMLLCLKILEGALYLHQFVLHLREYLGLILRLLQEKSVLTQLLLALDQLSFQFCNLRGLIDLFPLEGLQQIVHVLPHLVFFHVSVELRDLHGLLLGRFLGH